MRVWTAWFGSLGDSLVDIGNPFSRKLHGYRWRT